MLSLPQVEEPDGLNVFPVFYWNHVALQMNRITHSLDGPHTGPTMSSRALGLLHLAMHDAYFGALGNTQNSNPNPTYLDDADRPPIPAGVAWGHSEANEALTAAAITVLDNLYKKGGPGISIAANETITSSLSQLIADFTPFIDVLKCQFSYGEKVARVILGRLAVKEGQLGADAGRYEPKQCRYFFRDEPVNPVRRRSIDPNDPSKGTRAQRIYHGPFYGTEQPAFATTSDGHHVLRHPPEGDATYLSALQEVIALGGSPELRSTTRTPDQTVEGLYWAYDGANLIGTPPRLYNQIVRSIAWKRRDAAMPHESQTAEFVRLFALINTAMADAGKFAWKEKYKFEFWRPLSGVREHDTATGPEAAGAHANLDANADPFWLALGAPETNTNKLTFKPPFPAYPSGHATFGAACFQMVRLFYNRNAIDFDRGGDDDIGFSFVSEELNGVSRDLHQPYDPGLPLADQPGTVRTRVSRAFPSLWCAIFANAISRIYLGVHWRFDAFDPADVLDQAGAYLDCSGITYSGVYPRADGDNIPMGGVPLGLGIANDIWDNGMRAPGQVAAAMAVPATERFELDLKSSATNIR